MITGMCFVRMNLIYDQKPLRLIALRKTISFDKLQVGFSPVGSIVSLLDDQTPRVFQTADSEQGGSRPDNLR